MAKFITKLTMLDYSYEPHCWHLLPKNLSTAQATRGSVLQLPLLTSKYRKKKKNHPKPHHFIKTHNLNFTFPRASVCIQTVSHPDLLLNPGQCCSCTAALEVDMFSKTPTYF